MSKASQFTHDHDGLFRYPWYRDDVIKWKHFPCYWPYVQEIHRCPVNSPHKGQWCGALMFSLICTWTNSRANNGDPVDLRSHRAHNDVIVMILRWFVLQGYVMWVWTCLTALLFRLFIRKPVQANKKETMLCINGPFCWECTGDQWFPHTKGR